MIDVLANDSDADGVLIPGSVQVVSGPLNGAVSVNGSSGAITYTPNANFNGTDQFTYRVCDDDGACATALVIIVVNPINDPPQGVPDVYTVAEDTVLMVPAPGVLANDIEVDGGDSLSANPIAGPSNGSLSLSPNGSFVYTPALDFYGLDTFTYEACDLSTVCSQATVTITVTPVNDPPVAVADLAATTEDTAEIVFVLANDSDIDGPLPLAVTALIQPAHGTVSNNNSSVTYVPTLNFHGTDVFTYTVSDGLDTAAATVTVTVVPVNDPPVAQPDSYNFDFTGTLLVGAPGVLGNDSDPETNPLTPVLVSGPANGVLDLRADGSFDYTPAPAFSGPSDSFTYRASDGLATSDVVIVTIVAP